MVEPLSRELLLNQGHCCGNGCTNCPYKEKVMSDSKKKYEEIMEEEAEQRLASALAAASKARHQNRVPEPPNEPVPEKVESPAPDENEEMSAAEVDDIKKDISEIRSMITDNNRKLSKILSKLNFLGSNTNKPSSRSTYRPGKLNRKR